MSDPGTTGINFSPDPRGVKMSITIRRGGKEIPAEFVISPTMAKEMVRSICHNAGLAEPWS